VLYIDVQVNNPSRTNFTIHKPGLSLMLNGQAVASSAKGIDRVLIAHQRSSIIENIKINFSLMQAAVTVAPMLSNLIYGRPLDNTTTLKLTVTTDVFAALFGINLFSLPISVTVDLLEAMGTGTNGLGYVLAEKRKIKDGSEFDKYFPEAENSYTIVKPNGTVEDTVGFMAAIIDKWHKDAEGIAQVLKGDTVEETCQNIWNFCTTYLHYKPDKKGVEELRSPKRCWQDGQVLYRQQRAQGIPEEECSGIDCDCFTNLVCSILKCLKIPFNFRLADYTGEIGHVYVFTDKGNEIIIDPVYYHFNREKKYRRQISIDEKTLSKMKIAILNGTERTFEELTTGFSLAEIRKWEIERLYQLHSEAVAHPEKILAYGYHPAVYLQCLDYLIEYWNTVSRNKAIQIVEQKLREHNPFAGKPALNGMYAGLSGDPTFWVELGKGIVEFFVGLFSGPKKPAPTEQDKQAIQQISYEVASQVSSYFSQLFSSGNFTLDDIANTRKEAFKIRQTLWDKVNEFTNKFDVPSKETFQQVMGPVEGYFAKVDAFVTQLLNSGPEVAKGFNATVADIIHNGESPSKLALAKTQALSLKVIYGTPMGDDAIMGEMLRAKTNAASAGGKNIVTGRGGREATISAFNADKDLPGLLQRIMAVQPSGNLLVPPLPVFNAPTGGGSPVYTPTPGESGGGIITESGSGKGNDDAKQAGVSTPVIVGVIGTIAVLGFMYYQDQQKKNSKRPKQEA